MLERLNAHRDWANAKLVEWYLALPEGDDSCLKTLSHILLAEETWLARIRGRSHRDPREASLPRAELEPLRRAHRTAWEEVLAAGDTERVLPYKRLDGEPAVSTITEILLQVCTHGAHHRGQIAARAARMGSNAPPTDFILFARLH